jgi:RNA polymerase sigma-70 factor (ECF subfamily)
MGKQEQLSALLSATALRNEKAFAELYRLTAPHLFGVLLRILRQRELAEEAMQEAYVQIWNRAGDYRANQAQVMTWMTGIARYRALDMLRRQRDSARTESQEAELLEQLPDEHTNLDFYGQSEALLKCLQQLSDLARRAIALAYVDGYSHAELSQRFQAPLGSIKSLIRRGLQQLKQCLTP